MATKKWLIDANKAKFFIADILDIFKVPIGDKMANRLLDLMDTLPTVDAVEVVHGRWEWLGPNSLVPECMCGTCSNCKVRTKYIVNTELCPNCGAKMDGDGNG